MSLFDVIRYPIKDFDDPIIYDVPADIIIPWIEECYEILYTTCGIDYDLLPGDDSAYTVDTATLIHRLRMKTMFEIINLLGYIKPEVIEFAEISFIQLLKDRIKEYNL